MDKINTGPKEDMEDFANPYSIYDVLEHYYILINQNGLANQPRLQWKARSAQREDLKWKAGRQVIKVLILCCKIF